ncbi:MAG: hypothetical protein NTX54_08220 [Chloroflexi bacterium]|nr:hypothetical protein [Chloroflexota bacterium]
MNAERAVPLANPERSDPPKKARVRERVEASTTFTRDEVRMPDGRRLIYYRFPEPRATSRPVHDEERSGV